MGNDEEFEGTREREREKVDSGKLHCSVSIPIPD